MIIRKMDYSDKSKVEVFFGKMGGESSAFFNRGRGNEIFTLSFFENKTKNTEFFIAVEDDEMLGYVFLMSCDTLIPLLGIAVAENHKGEGIGYKLMTYAMDYAQEQGKGGIMLTTHIANVRGQSLYEKSGFEKIGTHGASGELFYLKRFTDKNYISEK